MKDISKRAGVSIRTVSRVVNGQGEISKATAERVQAIIQELGYRPNQMARGLVSNRTNSLGYVVTNLLNPFYAEVAEGLLDASRLQNYQIMLSTYQNSSREQLNILKSMVAQGVDGIIVFPSKDSISDLLQFAETFRPLIVLNHDLQHRNVSVVNNDVYRGGQMVVEYFAQQGHKAIGMINATRSIKHIREQGFRDAMDGHGIAYSEDMIVAGDNDESDIHGGAQAATKLLLQHPEITALFCYNDLIAIGAIQAAQRLGRKVPDDLAIIGCDDTFVGEIATPKLTTIRVDKNKMGSVAVDLSLSMLQDETTASQSILLDVDLVIRESA
jgi:LacI family transcriptional regulator